MKDFKEFWLHIRAAGWNDVIGAVRVEENETQKQQYRKNICGGRGIVQLSILHNVLSTFEMVTFRKLQLGH